LKGLGSRRSLVACCARRIPRLNRVVRLANHDQMIGLLLNDHAAALIRSVGWSPRLALAHRPGRRLAKQFYSRQRYYALTPSSNPAPTLALSRGLLPVLVFHPGNSYRNLPVL